MSLLQGTYVTLWSHMEPPELWRRRTPSPPRTPETPYCHRRYGVFHLMRMEFNTLVQLMVNSQSATLTVTDLSRIAPACCGVVTDLLRKAEFGSLVVRFVGLGGGAALLVGGIDNGEPVGVELLLEFVGKFGDGGEGLVEVVSPALG